MGYQPIKFTKKQYLKLKELIKEDFGNVSLPKGIYLITYLYQKYVPRNVKKIYAMKYGQPINKKRRNLKYE